MAVLATIRNFFVPAYPAEPEIIIPAPPTTYEIRTLMPEQLPEVLRLNIRCFRNGDNYTKHTFAYLLGEPKTLSYRIVTPSDELVGFAFVMVKENNAAHLTTIGISPEHRRRRLGSRMLNHIEEALRYREIGTVMLEVRVSNRSKNSHESRPVLTQM